MSLDSMKKFVLITEGIISEESGSNTGGLLDQLEEVLQQAVDIARELERDEIVGGAVKSYTRPWLQAWINDLNQIGSVYELRRRIEDEEDERRYREEEDRKYDAEHGDSDIPDDSSGLNRNED